MTATDLPVAAAVRNGSTSCDRSRAYRLRFLIETGESIAPLLHDSSHGWKQTLPHTEGRGFSLLMILAASRTLPFAINVTYACTEWPIGHPPLHGAFAFFVMKFAFGAAWA